MNSHTICSSEPWLCELSPTLHSNVTGFISFLESTRNKFRPNSLEEIQIQQKIEQLLRWKNVSERILRLSKPSVNPLRNQHYPYQEMTTSMLNSSRAPNCFIDIFSLLPESFKIFETTYQGKIIKIIAPDVNPITPTNIQRQHIQKQSRMNRIIEREENRDGEETKEFESLFEQTPTTIQNHHDLHHRHRFDLTSQTIENVGVGYVFDRSLRKVDTGRENREIFTAYKCEFCRDSKRLLMIHFNSKYIIKRVGKPSLDETIHTRFRREFKVQTLLTELNHPNINKIVHYFEDASNIYSVSNSAGDSDMLDLLQDYVKKFKCGFPEKVVKKLFKPTAEALLVAHNVGIVHRDVSLENLVLNNHLSLEEERIEVIDWGHATSTSRTLNTKDSCECVYEGPIGKTRYMAPELVFPRNLLNEGVDAQNLNRKLKYDPYKADVFAFGVCLFCVLVGQMPFTSIKDERGKVLMHSPEKLISCLNARARTPITLSPSALDLLNKTMKWEPGARISMEQVLKHEFFEI